MTRKAIVLNGPNLNLLGERDPGVYGTTTLAEIETLCVDAGRELDLHVTFTQSNHEGSLIDTIQQARTGCDALVANLGAYTHTSVAIMDALAVLEQPVIEVHLSNVHRRECFRRHSYVSQVADTVIAGAGPHGYVLALRHAASVLGGVRL